MKVKFLNDIEHPSIIDNEIEIEFCNNDGKAESVFNILMQILSN